MRAYRSLHDLGSLLSLMCRSLLYGDLPFLCQGDRPLRRALDGPVLRKAMQTASMVRRATAGPLGVPILTI
jgi:hypothetical protein